MKRTPKNYRGVVPTGKKLSDLLSEKLCQIQAQKEVSSSEIFKAWYEIIGEKMGPMTEGLSFVDGVLTIKVKSSTLYSLLQQHEKPRLFQQLKRKFPIKKLVFKIG